MHNTALNHGAGISVRCQNEYLKILNCTFIGNAVSEFGSGAAVHSAIMNSYMSLSACRFQGHHTGEYGTVFIGSDHADVSFNMTIWSENSANSGAAIYIGDFSQDVKIMSCICENNSAHMISSSGGGRGGCLFIEYANNLIISDSSFHGNSGLNGASLHISMSTEVHILNCTFRNNTSGDSGGALSAVATGFVFITDSLFENNRANSMYVNGSGGAIAAYQLSGIDIVNSTFIRNEGADKGGAV